MFGGVFDPDSINKKVAEKEAATTAPGFWDNQEKAQRVMNDIKLLKGRVEPWKELIAAVNDMEALYELGEESKDESVEPELRQMYEDAKAKFDNQSILNLLSGEVDRSSAFLTIHSGAGGTEAEDWAYMLSRMYIRWAERRGFKMETVDMLEAEGGIKSITLQINGDYVYGYLKGEAGIHRLVRISPFDANARRHTSFSSVFVFPVLDDTIKVDIRPEDLRVDTYRSGGKGGQHVNKTDSAVRITHLPTGIVVQCQNERSQHANRLCAMKILTAKLYDLKQKEVENNLQNLKGEYKEIAWGSQIRTYTLNPFNLIKDHRTNLEEGNVQAVLDGDLDDFIYARLHQK